MDTVCNLETNVCNLEKEVAKKNNDNSANDTTSVIKKITEIEENLQGSDKLGKQFKHLDNRVKQCENSSACNTYMLECIKYGVYDCLLDKGLPHPSYTEFKQRLQNFNNRISDCSETILKAKPHHWFHANFNPALEAVLRMEAGIYSSYDTDSEDER